MLRRDQQIKFDVVETLDESLAKLRQSEVSAHWVVTGGDCWVKVGFNESQVDNVEAGREFGSEIENSVWIEEYQVF